MCIGSADPRCALFLITPLPCYCCAAVVNFQEITSAQPSLTYVSYFLQVKNIPAPITQFTVSTGATNGMTVRVLSPSGTVAATQTIFGNFFGSPGTFDYTAVTSTTSLNEVGLWEVTVHCDSMSGSTTTCSSTTTIQMQGKNTACCAWSLCSSCDRARFRYLLVCVAGRILRSGWK